MNYRRIYVISVGIQRLVVKTIYFHRAFRNACETSKKTTTPLRSSGNDSANGNDLMEHINTGRDAGNGTSDPQSSQRNFSHKLLVETH